MCMKETQPTVSTDEECEMRLKALEKASKRTLRYYFVKLHESVFVILQSPHPDIDTVVRQCAQCCLPSTSVTFYRHCMLFTVCFSFIKYLNMFEFFLCTVKMTNARHPHHFSFTVYCSFSAHSTHAPGIQQWYLHCNTESSGCLR